MNKSINVVGAVACACFTMGAEASLIDRGNGLVYDDILNITWLQDARLATSETFGVSGIGYVDDRTGEYVAGAMTWSTAFEWIDAMNAASYLGFNTWRLPTVTPVNGVDFDYTVSYDGSTDRGFNNQTTANELSHLFYVGLGNLGLCSEDNLAGSNPDDCNRTPQDTWGLQNTKPFLNLVPGRYWTDVRHTDPNEDRAFDFDMTFGQTGTGGTTGQKYVWAVLDGDVGSLAPVPVPAAAWLFGAGLLGLAGIGRRRV